MATGVVAVLVAALANVPRVDWVAGAVAATEVPNLFWPNNNGINPASGVLAGVAGVETG